MKTFVLQRMVNVKFLPFTKDLHDILIQQDYTHLTNWGYIPDDTVLNYFGKGIEGYAMFPNQWLTCESGRWQPREYDLDAPDEICLTEKYAEIHMKSARLREIYSLGEKSKFYVLFDVKNSFHHRLLYNRIKHRMLPKRSYRNLKIYRSDTLTTGDTEDE